MRFALASGALALVCATGCSTYIPTEFEAMPVGGAIRVQLTKQAYDAVQLPSAIGRERYAGTLVRRDATQIVLHVPIEIGNPLGQDIVIPRAGIVLSENRVISRGRTTLAVGVGMGVLVGVVLSANHGGPLEQGLPDDIDHNQAFSGRMGGGVLRQILFSLPAP